MDYIVVGEVLKPQGIKGELKVRPFTDDSARFRKLRTVYFGDVPYKINSCRIDGFVYIKLDGVDTRNAAENFVGKEVKIDRIHAVSPKEGSYFIVDLIGCDLKNDSGVTLGRIKDIDNFGAADVITVETPEKKVFRFPFLNRIISNVDIDSKTISVVEKELSAVSVYED